MLREIELGGVLGKKFGKIHRLDVKSARESVQALSCLNEKFKKFFLEAHTKGMVFAFFVGERNITEEDVDMPAGSQRIRIQPVMEGSKKAGLLQTIVGAVMIIVGVILSFTPYAGASPYLIQGGIGLAAGGVIQMLSPQPRGLSLSGNDTENQANYAFGNPVNTVAQGNPVGLGYGFREIGGAIISAEITTEDF